jgi:hypothetical protein
MSLAEDEIDRLRLLDLDRGEFDFHSDPMVARRRLPVKRGTLLIKARANRVPAATQHRPRTAA